MEVVAEDTEKYRFSYAAGTAEGVETIITHEFDATDDQDAFMKKVRYLEDINGQYLDGSMRMLWQGNWVFVSDPSPIAQVAIDFPPLEGGL